MCPTLPKGATIGLLLLGSRFLRMMMDRAIKK